MRNGKRQTRKLHIGDDIDRDVGDTVTTIGFGKALMHFGNRHRHDLGIGLVAGREAVFEGIGLHHCPTPHVHIIDPSRILVTQQAEHVDVMD